MPQGKIKQLASMPGIKDRLGATCELTDRQLEAEAMFRSDAVHCMLFGGSRCVSGDTILDGHDITIKEMAEQGKPVPVLTSWGSQDAEAPFWKGRAKLLDVVTENGSSITVTPDHRFWNGGKWIQAQELDETSLVAVRSSSSCLPLTNSAYYPLGCGEDAQRWVRISAGLKNYLSSQTIDTPNSGGYNLEKIASITETAEQDYYTVHVPVVEQYYANGFLNHNSGKTFLIVREICTRAVACPGSRHAILRFRFNHVIASVAMDTLPKVMELCFPGVAPECKLDKSLWVYRFPNGGEIWFGGLDEKERTEKILGQEYATLFLNECSQIPLSSRDIALTRLAQNTALAHKFFYDCNPPSKRHWTHLFFVDHINPAHHQPLRNPDNYVCLQINPTHNRRNLKDGYLEELENLDERKRRRFLLGAFADDDDTALWTPEMLDKGRLLDRDPPPMKRVVIAVDPSGCSGLEDLRSDEVGIIVAGLGEDSQAYVLEDLSGRHGPEKWKQIVASAYDRYDADFVVAETNYGGAMVREVMRTATSNNALPIPFKEVKASRGKIVRAEPIAALFEQGKVSLVGRFPDLEYQLCAMTTAGWMGDKSPDRADAMVWALTSIFPAVAKSDQQSRRVPSKVVLGYSRSKRGRR